MDSRFLFAGDISKYKRESRLLLILRLGIIPIFAGFAFDRKLGITAVIIVMIAVIYVLWNITPEKTLIRFTEEDIKIFDKAALVKTIQYSDVRRLKVYGGYKQREYFELSTNVGHYSFIQPDGENRDEFTKALTALLTQKNKNAMTTHFSFGERWDY